MFAIKPGRITILFLLFTILQIFTSNSAEKLEINYRKRFCTSPKQNLFSLPFDNFILMQNSISAANEEFLGAFNVKHGGMVQCASSELPKSHFELCAMNKDTFQPIRVSVDLIGHNQSSFESSKHSWNISECSDEVMTVPVLLAANSSIADYNFDPAAVPFEPVLITKDSFVIRPKDGCEKGSYSFQMLDSVNAHNRPEVERISTDIEISIGRDTQPQLILNRLQIAQFFLCFSNNLPKILKLRFIDKTVA